MKTAFMLHACVTLGLVGCQSQLPREGPVVGQRIETYRRVPNSVIFTSEIMRNKLSVEDTGGRTTAPGNLEAWAVLRNRTNYPQQVEFQGRFFDRSEVPVEENDAWQRAFLDPQATQTLRAFSTKPVGDQAGLAHSYLLEVREAR